MTVYIGLNGYKISVCQESEVNFGKRNIELIIDEAWQLATHHIVGI